MKKLFIMLAAAATVASCANEETVMEAPGQAIEFGAPFVDNATRVAAGDVNDPSYSTTGNGVALTKFNVYGAVGGVNIFDGDEVVKGSTAWALANESDKKYWINGADYEFVAIVDGNKKDGETVITETTVDNASGIPTSIAYNSDGATDLLCARVVRNAVDGVTNTSMVEFDFTHLLSKVKFSVENISDNATNYRFVVTEVKIFNALESNTYNVTTGAWATFGNSPERKEFTLVNTLADPLDNLTVASGATQYHSTELLLLPGVNVGVTVKANIEAYDNISDTWKPVSGVEKTFNNVLGADKTLVANNAYHFAVKLSVGSEIQFTANALPDWNYDVNGDDVVDNDDIVEL